MPRHVLKAALLCAVIAFPAAAQSQDARVLQEMLAARGEASAYLGVSLAPLTETKAKQLKIDGTKGALVERVMPNSPAEKAGLEDNDVIVSIDHKTISSERELRELLLTHKAEDKVQLEIMRDGRRQTLEATLAERQMFGDMGVFTTPEGFDLYRGGMPEGFRMGEPYVMMFPGTPRLGVSVLPMTDDLREYFGAERGKGVLISAVSKGSAAERAGLRAGDVVLSVDGQAVSRAGDIARALRPKDGDGPRTVQIEILRDRSRQTVPATVEGQKLMNEE